MVTTRCPARFTFRRRIPNLVTIALYFDRSADEKPEKSIARKMIKMTNRINKKFFHGKTKVGDADAVLAVQCATCHHGEPHPEFEKKEEPKQ